MRRTGVSHLIINVCYVVTAVESGASRPRNLWEIGAEVEEGARDGVWCVSLSSAARAAVECSVTQRYGSVKHHH